MSEHSNILYCWKICNQADIYYFLSLEEKIKETALQVKGKANRLRKSAFKIAFISQFET